MPRLAIFLLGSPRIELDGEPVHIGRKKALALLAYLAITPGSHRRDALATLLWPDYDQRTARAHLRRALVSLTNRLGSQWFVADRETVGLNPASRLWLDVDKVRQCLAACEAHRHAESAACLNCLALLTEATELYRDDFMAGFTLPDSLPFDEWQRHQARRLGDDLGSVLERLSTCHAAQGEYELAIEAAQRWLELDPLHEAAHRRLMELYGQAGRSAAALRQYRACTRVLEQELGVPPSAETTVLYKRLRDERLVRDEKPTPPPAPTGRAITLPAFLDDGAAPIREERHVFVARETELEWLDDRLEAALESQGKVVFVTGGPGRGKTALLREFTQRALAAHPDLLAASGNCSAFSGVGDPYLPFREIMAMLTSDVEARWAVGIITREHARRLWAALPLMIESLLDHGTHLIETFVPGPALLSRAQTLGNREVPNVSELQEWVQRRRTVSGGLDQSRIFQQFADTLWVLAAEHPLLLTLDDLQWVDNASASLLFYLGRRLAEAGGRVLILGAYRPEEVTLDREGERHPLRKVLSEFRRTFGDGSIDLAATDEVRGRAFVDAYLDSEPNELGKDFRSALSDRTGGHALFTIELLRAMQERGELVRGPDGAWTLGAPMDWERLPARVEAAVQERIERLDEDQRDLLMVASVEGEVFTAQAVAQAHGLSERGVLRALSQELGTRGHHLVHEAGEVTLQKSRQHLSRYQFGHALFQAYLYGCLTAGERRLLHGDIAAALEGLYVKHTDQVAPALAQHYDEAGHLEKAIAYSERAAELAFAAHAYETAVEHNQRSLRMYRQLGDRAGEAKLLCWLSNDYSHVGDFSQAEKCTQEALRIYREVDDPLGKATTLHIFGWNCLHLGDSTRTESSFLEALSIYREIGELREQANVLAGLGRLYREYTGDFGAASACGKEARRLGQEAGDLFNETIGEFNIGFALHYQGNYNSATLHMQRFVKVAYDNREWLLHGALGLVGVGLNAIALGDYVAAAAHLEQSRSTFRELFQEGHDDYGWIYSALALLHHHRGENQTAREYATRAVDIHRRGRYKYRLATALNRLGHALTALGELSNAVATYQEALDIRRELGQRHLAPEPLAGLARIALVQKDRAAALAYVEEILTHLKTGSPSSRSGHELDGTDEPMRIFLTCYQVLQANADPRAEEILTTAYNLLQERAAKIDDEELRRSFLENVRAHREIASEFNSTFSR